MARNQIVGNSGNTAEVDENGAQLMSLMGSYVGYSNKPKPTPPNRTDVTYSLLELDTKLIYIWDGTTWVVW